MNNNKGFTLIELVIVIVILGILAATAAPKFIDLTGDARESVIKGVQGSINSAADIAHAKALIEGETSDTGNIDVGGASIALAFGWPTNNSISELIELSTDSGIVEASGAAGTFQHEDAETLAECQVVYSETSDSEVRPGVVATTTGC
ncbi:type II secretion system protein [Thalassotalea nanhaiensis]|uniref:Type II secretion system protein n=1 Tax=Thalassotalea nanhaiensis TaxID=3065648 RepID=A0ABY9TH75_9GAMM|nr:type II secretion system protein [Colwelliaceae bacterium SQ345]